MAKKRGLPANFDPDVDEDDAEALSREPVDLDDFVDSTIPNPRAPRKPAPKPPVRKPEPRPTPAPRAPDLPRAERSGGGGEQASPPPRSPDRAQPEPPPRPPARKPRRTGAHRRPSRKEIGLDPQTIAKLEELVSDIRVQSREKNPKASEVVRAAISALHEARRFTDFSQLGRRGQWGSLNARNYLTDLQDIYLRALWGFGRDRFGG